MQSVTPTAAERNRTQNAVNLIARHMSDRPGKHITARQVAGRLVWKVESQTRADVTYTVTLTADGWEADTCSCEDSCYRHLECKHLKAVKALVQPAQPAAPAPIAWTSDTRKASRRTEREEEI